MKSPPIIFVILFGLTFPFCNLPKHIGQSLNSSRDDTTLETNVIIISVPTSFKFDTFYKKYVSANGIPVISSDKVPNEALLEARAIINKMLRKILLVRNEIIKNKVRVAVMSSTELPTDIPEHRDLNIAFPETDWNTRGRGYGATLVRPATSCAEENLLCYANDRYRGENILVHEFAHTIHELGLRYTDASFEKKLGEAFKNAKRRGLWKSTYAMSNKEEYWAEGVQDWFNVNLYSIPANGIHNEIHTQVQLKTYDPELYDLVSFYFYEDDMVGCQDKK